jgi:hypothetical protein
MTQATISIDPAVVTGSARIYRTCSTCESDLVRERHGGTTCHFLG